MNSPISSETTPLTGASVEMKTAQLSPKQASQKYSAELNLSANSASAGAEKASTAAPNSPPIAEVTGRRRERARPLPSRHPVGVLDIGGGRRRAGMRSRVPEMSPAKIAIALAAMIAPIAGTGSMKKVSGTRRAVAMVAVSPGRLSTIRPKTDEQTNQDHVRIENQPEGLPDRAWRFQ